MGDTENKATEPRESIRERRRREQGGTSAAIFQENKSMLILFGVIVAALLVILVSIMGLKVPVVPVCVIVLIEAALSVCLHDVPIWLHGLVVIAQIVAGILCGRLIFIALCALIYLVGILALKFIRE